MAQVHYSAESMAHGGPAFDGPKVNVQSLDVMMPVALVLLDADGEGHNRYGIICPLSGEVMAESDSMADLLPWLEAYANGVDSYNAE